MKWSRHDVKSTRPSKPISTPIPSARVLIIGYGNSLRCDDSVGCRAAEQLAQSMRVSGVEILACHQLMPELADKLRQTDAVVFVDATREGKIGEVNCSPILAQPCSPNSHASSPEGILALACQLYGVAPRAFAVTLAGECFGHGDSLSPAVEAGFPTLIHRVESLVKQLTTRPRQRNIYCTLA